MLAAADAGEGATERAELVDLTFFDVPQRLAAGDKAEPVAIRHGSNAAGQPASQPRHETPRHHLPLMPIVTQGWRCSPCSSCQWPRTPLREDR